MAGVAALGVVEDSLAEVLDGIGTGRVLSRAQLSTLRKCLPALRRARDNAPQQRTEPLQPRLRGRTPGAP